MKAKTLFLFLTILSAVMLGSTQAVTAQQYKLRQSTATMGMKSESTIYVKGSRKRTEGGGYMGMTNPTTIEQCDLQRTIKINDKKKVYFIEPFAKDAEEIDEDAKPVKAKPAATAAVQPKSKTGGVITMWYTITDTGERKKMYGITARHVWTTQKIKPSADACTMKDSMIIKTDGWYIDLPQFNCPVRYTPTSVSRPNTPNQPQCIDRYVSRRSGKGKLGFPLEETRTMIMGNGSMTTNEFKTTIETLEFSTAKLDSMLFEIPPGYRQVSSEEELQDKMDVNAMMQYAGNTSGRSGESINPGDAKKSGAIRIGVYEPKGNDQLDVAVLQERLVAALSGGKIEAIAVSSEAEAKKYNCDWLLSSEFTKVKQGSKVGGLLKAIKNTDPLATSSFTIEASLTLASVADKSVQLQQKVNGKYEGKADMAASQALEEGSSELIKDL